MYKLSFYFLQSSATASIASSISSSVLKYEKLNLTIPLSTVPSASCALGAQCPPGLVAISYTEASSSDMAPES